MHYTEDDLRAAQQAGVIDAGAVDRLVQFLGSREPAAAQAVKFDIAHLLWYAGALIVIAAMGLFTTVVFSEMGGGALLACAIAYAVVFTVAGHHLWTKRNLRTPGGLLISVAVSMAPMAVYGVQDMLGWWGRFGDPGAYEDFYVWIKGSWVFMEVATVIAGVIALRYYRFPFIVSIIAVALLFLSMDLTPWIFGTEQFSWEMRRQVSMWFGLGVLIVAWIVDCRARGVDFAFWLHLFGLMAFWGGLSLTDSSSELGKALYCLLNVGLVFLAVFLMRRAYAVFGTIGISMYMGHLANVVFKDSLLFPFALSLIGVAVIGAGLLYFRKREAIAAWLDERLPQGLQHLRPVHAR